MHPKLLPLRPIFRPIVSSVFPPHKLRYHSLGPSKLQKRLLLNRTLVIAPTQLGTVRLSTTRSGRERMGAGREVRVGASSSKSLIDDEAELSDWVGGLSSSSFKKTKLYSDSEDDVGGGGDVGSDKFRSRDKLGKRRRESGMNRDPDFYGTPRRGGMSKDPNFNATPRRGGSERERGGGYDRGLRGKGRDFGDFKKREKFGGGSEVKRENGDRFPNQRRNGKGLRTQYGNVEREYNRDRGVLGVEREKNRLGRRGFNVMDDVDDVEEEVEEEEQDKGHGSFKELIDSDDEVDEDDEGELDGGDHGLVEARSDFPRPPQSSSETGDSYLSESRFDQCPISPLSLRAIKDAGYERMTTVQEATLPLILKGKDVMAKAKTGTGKTVAFLLPAIELVAKLPPADRDQKRPPIYVLVICPTRELASQATAEANKLLKYHPTIGVQVVIGGTRLALEQKRMQANPCQILVATPGRLRDHIENTAGFATKLMGVKVLVLDEADHLLDMGFRKEIERIVSAVPKQRQTLLFSATIPPEVRQICHIALKRDHEFINTVKEGSEDTHAQVRQTHLIAPLDKHFPLLYSLLKEHIADDVNYKIIVFCTTAMVTRLVAEVLGELKLNVREIHSRKPQSYRTRVSDEFRKSKGLILVTSDVSARGVDYPDVTLVVQIGVPSDKQQYIHRLGRTGRKGKEGQGILMLAPWEEFFLSNIKDLPISKATEPLLDPDTTKKVERALSHAEMKSKEAAYQAWLGYYNSNKNIGRDKCRLVQLANEFSRSMGLDNPPAIPKLVLGKMGLKNIPGLRSK